MLKAKARDPSFDDRGFLLAGIHEVTWDEFKARFGTTAHRRRLLAGLKAALESLAEVGCRAAYIDGSFVGAKDVPAQVQAEATAPYRIFLDFFQTDKDTGSRKGIVLINLESWPL